MALSSGSDWLAPAIPCYFGCGLAFLVRLRAVLAKGMVRFAVVQSPAVIVGKTMGSIRAGIRCSLCCRAVGRARESVVHSLCLEHCAARVLRFPGASRGRHLQQLWLHDATAVPVRLLLGYVRQPMVDRAHVRGRRIGGSRALVQRGTLQHSRARRATGLGC